MATWWSAIPPVAAWRQHQCQATPEPPTRVTASACRYHNMTSNVSTTSTRYTCTIHNTEGSQFACMVPRYSVFSTAVGPQGRSECGTRIHIKCWSWANRQALGLTVWRPLFYRFRTVVQCTVSRTTTLCSISYAHSEPTASPVHADGWRPTGTLDTAITCWWYLTIWNSWLSIEGTVRWH